MITDEKTVWKLIDSFDYQTDRRNPPDIERQRKFKAGWTKSLDADKEEYSEETLKSLTWDNLGYRLGLQLNEIAPEEQDMVYQFCVNHFHHIDVNAWLVITTEDPVLLGDGYEDILDKVYSWDNRFPNHAKIQVGDALVLWDRHKLLGFGIIQTLEMSPGNKTTYSCPNCGKSGVQTRKKMTSRYYCPKCKSRFNNAKTEVISVDKYRAVYADTWVELTGELDGSTLRNLCEKPGSQHSLRSFKWREFVGKLSPERRKSVKKTPNLKDQNISSGHQKQMVRVRKGQSAFRSELLKRFGDTCAFSGTSSRHVLDAAHLYSYAATGTHDMYGGLMMRKDLHRLFDMGLIRVNPTTNQIQVDETLLHIPGYKGLNNKKLLVDIPSKTQKWLRIHWDYYGSQT